MNKETREIIESRLRELMQEVKDNHINAGQRASGKTIESLKIESDENSVGLLGRKYFGVLETGRKPGKVPKGFYKTILEWAKSKQNLVLDDDTSIQSFAWRVAYKIATEGTKLFREGGRNDIYSIAVERAKKDINTAIGRMAIESVTNIKTNL
jgi:hypothetical protein